MPPISIDNTGTDFAKSVIYHRQIDIKADLGVNQPTHHIIGLLEDGVTLGLSSSFSPLSNNLPSGLLTGLQTVTRFAGATGAGFSGAFQQMGLQTWTGTEPLSLRLSVGFYANSNSIMDVKRPAIALASLPLPTLTGSSGNLVPPGPTIKNAFRQTNNSSNSSNSQNREGVTGYDITIRVGSICTLKNVIVKSATPTFSVHVDSNNGPLFAKVELEVESVIIPTQQYVENCLI